MSDIVLNGSTYSGTPTGGTLYKPVSIAETIQKVASVIVAESGARTLVYRGVKREWSISWQNAPESTRAALAALAALSTTFAYVDEHGTSYTVITEPGDHKCQTNHTDRSNAYFYDIDLTLHEA